MKKLMIAAASAAMIGGAFADAPQVYDMTLTVKQALCSGKTAADPCNDGDKVYYKTQSTVKYQGLFWGCGCDVIACPAYYTDRFTDGFLFWNASTKQWAAHNATFAWGLLNAVGQKGQNVEGQWTLQLEDCDGTVVADYTGAGYGTATWACGSEDNVIKSMNGNLVGINNIALGADVTGCKYCGNLVACTSWAFCDDCGIDDDTLTASFGSWTLKYNSGLTKKLAQGKYIDEAYKFLAAVKDEMACIEAGAEPAPVDPTAEKKAAFEKADKAWKDAKVAWEAAVANNNAVKANDVKQSSEYKAADEKLALAQQARETYEKDELKLAAVDYKNMTKVLAAMATKVGITDAADIAQFANTYAVTLDKDYPIIGYTKGYTGTALDLSTALKNKATAYATLFDAKYAAKGETTTAVKNAQEWYDFYCDVLNLVIVEFKADTTTTADQKAYLDKMLAEVNTFQALWDVEEQAYLERQDIVAAWKTPTAAEKKAAQDAEDAALQTYTDLGVIRSKALSECGAACL